MDRMETDEDVDEDEDEDEIVRDMESEGWMYRALREESGTMSGKEEREIGNEWTQIPCGKCPVFQFCTEDGPVNPGNCEYFKKWLEI